MKKSRVLMDIVFLLLDAAALAMQIWIMVKRYGRTEEE